MFLAQQHPSWGGGGDLSRTLRLAKMVGENHPVIEYASPLSKRIWGKGVAVSVASCGMFGVAVVLEKTCV